MSLFAQASSFASRKNAVRKLTQVLGADFDDHFSWMIIVQENGRFTPVIRLKQHQAHLVHFAEEGICVM